MGWPSVLGLAALVFVVAAFYSSVGHGGASGYLAVLALFGVPPEQMACTALILNVLVAGLASVAFFRAGHFSARMLWPFAVTSIPCALAGGFLKVSNHVFVALLTFALLATALRLSLAFAGTDAADQTRPVRLKTALPVGAGIGLLSGMVGIGGGVFLSPVMLLSKWATAKQTAATAAVFIVVNSLAGLTGRLVNGGLDVVPMLLPLAAAFGGGLIGSYWGANRFSGLSLRRTLALVLALAAVKLAIAAF